MLARLPMTLDACLVLISNSPAIALTRAPLVIAFVPALAFIAFVVLGGNILLSAADIGEGRKDREVARLDQAGLIRT